MVGITAGSLILSGESLFVSIISPASSPILAVTTFPISIVTPFAGFPGASRLWLTWLDNFIELSFHINEIIGPVVAGVV